MILVRNSSLLKIPANVVRAITFFIVACYSVTTVWAQYPEQSNPPRLVNDLADMLSAGDEQALESKLVEYDDSTGTQIAIVTIATLDGAEKAQYAIELGEKWGIGGAKMDNGVLILVARDDRQMFIATGRGVEQYLPDIVCKRIVENVMKPQFKAGDYYGGLDLATDEMIARLSGNFVNDDPKNDDRIPLWVIILIIFIVFFILPIIFRGKGGGGTTYGGRGWNSGPVWGGGGGGWSSGGGGSSGGFGGFGGGSFGGGGAGGSW
jgi:uncharacterized protein